MTNSIDSNAVSLAALAIVATTVAGIIWLAKYFAKTLSKDLREHTKAAIAQADSNGKLAQSNDKLTIAVDGMQSLLDSLNGKVAKAVVQTIQEQNVEHQVIKKQDKE